MLLHTLNDISVIPLITIHSIQAQILCLSTCAFHISSRITHAFSKSHKHITLNIFHPTYTIICRFCLFHRATALSAGTEGATVLNNSSSTTNICSTVRCHHRHVCLADGATHRPRCVSCTSKCPRSRRQLHQQHQPQHDHQQMRVQLMAATSTTAGLQVSLCARLRSRSHYNTISVFFYLNTHIQTAFLWSRAALQSFMSRAPKTKHVLYTYKARLCGFSGLAI